MNAPTVTTITTYDAVLDLNAKAISCMAIGDYKGCTLHLENALREYRRHSQVPRLVPAASEQQQREASLHLQSVALPLPPSTTKTGAGVSQFGGPSVLTIFQKAFVAVDHRMEPPNTNETIIPALLIYNMGLSFHLEAISTGISQTMMRAHEFYRYSMSVLERGQNTLRPRPLLAALANNMAHVSSSLFHHANLRTSMMMLKNLMDEMQPAGTAGSHATDLQEDEIDVFAMNWVFYSEYHHIATAAAA